MPREIPPTICIEYASKKILLDNGRGIAKA